MNHDPPEECEVFFFLYDSESSTQISERFMTHAEASKSMKSVREQDKGAALFTVSQLPCQEMFCLFVYLFVCLFGWLVGWFFILLFIYLFWCSGLKMDSIIQ